MTKLSYLGGLYITCQNIVATLSVGTGDHLI